MHPSKYKEIDGARLAFAQGGKGEMRLVLLTPRVKIERHKGGLEATWPPEDNMPFQFESAPTLIRNRGISGKLSDFDLLEKMVARVNRSTPVAKFSSCFRSRRLPVEEAVAREIIEVYRQHRNDRVARIAESYAQARPIQPVPCLNREQRKQRYEALLGRAASPCRHCKGRKTCRGR
jgi:hypothetical protein